MWTKKDSSATYYCLLQRHCRIDSRTITVYCNGTVGLIPVLLLSIAEALRIDSHTITLYFSGTVGLIAVLLLSIAAALWD